ncbi:MULTISPECIES: hypothetical protein [unclassified Aureispira]|uniref:hypothetical protein n=1 Tax=unclassified Aureispira TaxID=2649989 RepID=UPI000697DAEF|nr:MULTISPECIES: hypothetical protein [unclassified Aureispira]WMX16617.1 hypothetical protein QP953_09585 [Aureispira sp. CCB-E]
MKKQFILLVVMALLLHNCQKYEAQYGIETAEETVLGGNTYEIAYCTEEGVFLLTGNMKRAKKVVSFANKLYPEAKHVALSIQKDRVAYIDPDTRTPVIVDTMGNVLEELTQYTNTNDLGWHNGDRTLYILANNQVHFYGEALSLPNALFVQPPSSYDYEVTSLDINDDLDVAYGAIYYKASGSYRNWYYSYHYNYKAPNKTDESHVNSYGSYHFFQNVGADTKRFYHTIRFSEPEYSYTNRDAVVIVYGLRTQSEERFDRDYILRKNNFELSVRAEGSLFKKPFQNYSNNFIATIWSIDLDYDEPMYVDWAIGF